MNYWHMQLHDDDKEGWKREDILEILKYSLIGCSGKPVILFHQIKLGDIVLIRHGGDVLALTQALENPRNITSDEKNEYIWFDVGLKVKVLEYYVNKSVGGKGWFIPKTLMSIDNEIAYDFVANLYKEFKNKEMVKDIVSLLKYKHQVILQGAPGTGKTYSAKKTAEVMTKPIETNSISTSIELFFRNFDANTTAVKERKVEDMSLLSAFSERFPQKDLKNLSLERYCIGKGDRNNFCWWIERGLHTLGRYSPGTSKSYLIFWSKSLDSYSKHGRLFDNAEDDNDAMKRLATTLSLLVNEKSYKDAQHLGDSFILKILHSYFPDEYFPINSVKCIDNVLLLLGITDKGLGTLEKNQKIQEYFVQKKKEFGVDITSFEFMRFLFTNFNLRGDIDLKDNQTVPNKGESLLIQFHPAYSYEDFVRGIAVQVVDDKPKYITTNKVVAQFAQKALENESANYVLIIDEINRANLPSVLGELIYALEYRGESVESMYDIDGDRSLILPPNLYIIGTMNTADRSVGHIDYAIRRRFAFVDIPADESVISLDKAKKLFSDVKAIFKEHLTSDFELNDIELGHSYYLAHDNAELALKLKYEIKPILREYVKDGILLNGAKKEIENLNV